MPLAAGFTLGDRLRRSHRPDDQLPEPVAAEAYGADERGPGLGADRPMVETIIFRQ
jgi:hypothetical protein